MIRSAPKLTLLGKLAWLSLAYNVAVILWGAFVRASKSGAGCGAHWPLCKGRILPDLADATTRIELTHRVTSGLSLVFAVALMIAAWRVFPRGHLARRAANFFCGFMLAEALVGAALVLLEYVALDPSAARAGWMALHLANTFFLLASNVAFAHFASHDTSPTVEPRRAAATAAFVALVAIFIIALTGSQAALADTLFPARSLVHGITQDLTPGGHFLLKLRVIHPFVAMFSATFIIIGVVVAQALHPSRTNTRLTLTASILVVTQIALGFTNVALLAPVWMQITHLFVADSLWITVTLIALETRFTVWPPNPNATASA